MSNLLWYRFISATCNVNNQWRNAYSCMAFLVGWTDLYITYYCVLQVFSGLVRRNRVYFVWFYIWRSFKSYLKLHLNWLCIHMQCFRVTLAIIWYMPKPFNMLKANGKSIGVFCNTHLNPFGVVISRYAVRWVLFSNSAFCLFWKVSWIYCTCIYRQKTGGARVMINDGRREFTYDGFGGLFQGREYRKKSPLLLLLVCRWDRVV